MIYEELKFPMSEEVRLVFYRYLEKEISKKQFRQEVTKTKQCREIARRFKEEERKIEYFTIEKRPEDTDFSIYVTLLP